MPQAGRFEGIDHEPVKGYRFPLCRFDAPLIEFERDMGADEVTAGPLGSPVAFLLHLLPTADGYDGCNGLQDALLLGLVRDACGLVKGRLQGFLLGLREALEGIREPDD